MDRRDHGFMRLLLAVYISAVMFDHIPPHHTSTTSAPYSTPFLEPSRTYPIYQLLMPLAVSSSISCCFLAGAMQISSPPLVSAAYPQRNLKLCTLFSIFISPRQIGSLLMIRSTFDFCASARQLVWPRMPKPVTSVHALARYFLSSPAPTRLRVAICSSALQNAYTSSDSLASCRILSRFSLLVLSHCMALMASLAPNGFVRMMASPGEALLGMTNSLSLTTAMAHPPIMGHWLQTVCPPPTCAPACCAASVKPWIIRVVDTSFSASFISVDTPRIISTSLMSVMPIAYRSETVLQKAIRPNMYGDSTRGQKKSRVETRVQGGTLMVETSGVSMPTGLGSLLRQERSLFCGTLQPHPFILVKLVSTKSLPRPWSTGLKMGIGGGLPLGGYVLKEYPMREARLLPRDILNIYYHKYRETHIKLPSCKLSQDLHLSPITIIKSIVYGYCV